MKASRRRFLALAGGQPSPPPRSCARATRRRRKSPSRCTISCRRSRTGTPSSWRPGPARSRRTAGTDQDRHLPLDAARRHPAPASIRSATASPISSGPRLDPGRFPGMEVVELPFIAARRGVERQGDTGVYETQLKEEFREVHPDLPVVARPWPRACQQAGQDDGRPEGPKLRSPTRQAAEALRRSAQAPSPCRCRRCQSSWRSGSSTAP